MSICENPHEVYEISSDMLEKEDEVEARYEEEMFEWEDITSCERCESYVAITECAVCGRAICEYCLDGWEPSRDAENALGICLDCASVQEILEDLGFEE